MDLDKQFSRAQRQYDNQEPPYGEANSGRVFIGEWWTFEDEQFLDVEVELDNGNVLQAWSCGIKAPERLLLDLENRYEDD